MWAAVVWQVVVVLVTQARAGPRASRRTSSFQLAAHNLAPPLPTTGVDPSFPSSLVDCGGNCSSEGVPACIGFAWLREEEHTAAKVGEAKAVVGRGRGQGRCWLLQCLPHPSTLTPAPGAHLYLLSGPNKPNYGPSAAPTNYRMGCTFAYRIFRTTKLTFQEAQQRCQQDGAHLLIIKSAEQEQVIQQDQDYHRSEGFWVGLSDQEEEGHYHWVDGSQPTYTHWSQGQPNNFMGKHSRQDQDCAMLYRGGWNDNQCHHTLHFICQIIFLNL